MYNMVFNTQARCYMHSKQGEFGREWSIYITDPLWPAAEECWHCEFGPAMYYHGTAEWWLLDCEYEFNEWLTKIPVTEQFKLKLMLKYA